MLECRRLRRRYPRSYSDPPAAFGFILYNPWTELSDITLNLDTAERIGLQEFRGQLTRAKLRLYPDTALFYKAKHEDLLSPRFPYEAMDSARRYGYEAEVPWRFQHLAADRAYGVHDAVFRAVGKHEEVRMLREIVRFLERRPDRWAEPVSVLARDIVRGLGVRFQRDILHGAPSSPGPARPPLSGSAPLPGSAPPRWTIGPRGSASAPRPGRCAPPRTPCARWASPPPRRPARRPAGDRGRPAARGGPAAGAAGL